LTESTPASPEPQQPPPPPPAAPAHGRSRILWVLPVLLLLVLAAPLLAGAGVFLDGPLDHPGTVVIPHGANIHEIAELMTKSGVVRSELLFRAAARLLANDAMKAGEYEFPAHVSIADAVRMIHDGRSVVRMFTLAEGVTSAEAVEMLNDIPLSGTVTAAPAEGALMPETYRYSFGDSRSSFIARMQKGMQTELNAAWDKRDPAVPAKSVAEALVMASIIEKETAKPEERPRIARVFYNRLALNMALQSDPTVIYALTQGKGPLGRPLTHADLATVSPYNTYAVPGLPPGPICNPGKASIEAALHPEPNDFLYFVADGTGGHVFSKDLAQHNQNVAKWANLKKAQPQEQ